MPCHRSYCPTTTKSRCCYSSTCLHKLNNRLWRHHETLDHLETQLAAAESAIASLTRRLERECHQDCRQDCTTTRAARKFYEDQMECDCDRNGSGGSSSCACPGCGLGNKDFEIRILKKRIGVAEDFEDLLRELDEKRRRCRAQLILNFHRDAPVRVVQEQRVRIVANLTNSSFDLGALSTTLSRGWKSLY